MSGTEPEPPGAIASALLRLTLDPRSGKLARGRTVDVCLRAATFCDLILAGAIVTDQGGPRAVQTGEPAPEGSVGDAGTGTDGSHDKVLSAVLSAIARRPGVRWARWFTHVSEDRFGVARRLVAAGLWVPRADGARRFTDTEAEAMSTRHDEVRAVQRFARGPHSAPEAVLAYLLDLIDGAKSRAALDRWLPVLTAAFTEDERAEPVAASLLAALGGGTSALRRRGVIRRG